MSVIISQGGGSGGSGGGDASLYARYADIFAEKCYEFQVYLYEDNIDFGMLYGWYVKLNGITGGLPTFLSFMGYNGDGLGYSLSLIGTSGEAEENGQDINYIGQDSFGWYFTTTPMYVFGNAKPYPFMTYYPVGHLKIRCYAYGQSDYADSFTIFEQV